MTFADKQRGRGVNLTIVGLGMIGTSVGLALKAATGEITVTGHDPDAAHVQRAKKLGAIDKSHWNLPSACEDADLILFDLSAVELEKTLAALIGGIKEQAVLLDTVPLKQPILEMAARVMPQTTRFVGGHIVPTHLPSDYQPSAALIQGAVFYLVAPERIAPQALDLASNFALAIGAEPRYVDALEHDGLMAATAQLPNILTLALVEALSGPAGARDRAQAVGAELASLRQMAQTMPEGTAELIAANAAQVLRWLDTYLSALTDWRSMIASGDGAALGERLAQALTTGEEWLKPEHADANTNTVTGGWRQMLLGNLGAPRSRSK